METGSFLQPFVGQWLAWFYADSTWWTVIGLFGNAIFSARFLVQWITSERKQALVVPPIFWHLSFWGSLVTLVYAFHVDKLPIILGYVGLPFIYGRNLVLLRRHEARDSSPAA